METKKKIHRYIAIFLAVNLLFEVISPTVAMALTYGPYQPEYVSFEPAAASEMVDLFTGDFKYNIPLMDVDGYPLNLSYHAGVTMDEEASWVGLGWGLNAGAITRSIHGIPDDFNGDQIKTVSHIKDQEVFSIGADKTINTNGSISYYAIGIGHGTYLSDGVSLVHNNYKGWGLETYHDIGMSLSLMASYEGFGINGSVGGNLGVKLSTLDGTTFNYGYSYGYGTSIGLTYGAFTASYFTQQTVGVGTSFNIRTGEAYKTYSGSTSDGVSLTMAYKVNKNGASSQVGSASWGNSKSPGTTANSSGGASLSWGNTTSHTIPVSSMSYFPRMLNNFTSSSNSYSLKIGFYLCAGISYGVYGFSFSTGDYQGLNFMYQTSKLADPFRNRNAYGYLNLENTDSNSLLDFNRSSESPLHKESPNLPLIANSYDLYTATAQGLMNNFRPHRSDVGVVYDNTGTLMSHGTALGAEVAGGLFAHFGVSKFTNSTNGTNGRWDASLNKSQNYYSPDVTTTANKSYEKYYFKTLGELVAVDQTFNGKINSTNLVSPGITIASPTFIDATSPLTSTSIGPGQNAVFKTKREIRNTYYGNLNAFEASQYGFEKDIKQYPQDNISFAIDPIKREVTNYTSAPRVFNGNNNHLSEMTVTSADGSRYIYGIPNYNKTNKKVVFNASVRDLSNAPVVPLSHNSDNSIVYYDNTSFSTANKRGIDNLYREQTIPQYPQSFLLSCIISSDYVDVTGDGPSFDDLGEYTKFNYRQFDNYQWRTPIDNHPGAFGSAILDKGLIADEFDDKGVVDYGVKELRYLHSVETKNYVAEFSISKRKDAVGVNDINGAMPATSDGKMYRLDSIKLYSKNEKLRGPNATPIKTVHFNYDYSLCPNVPNNENVISGGGSDIGKLTLTSIYFTYGKSDKGSLAPYQFTYATNPGYDLKSTDRWGNYKPNNGVETGKPGTGLLNNDEFPYAEQDRTKADSYAASWNLSSIITPTGAKINIDYEADDYGYVQNEPTGQMLKIADVSFTKNPLANDILNYGTGLAGLAISGKDYIMVDLSGLKESGVLLSEANNSFLLKNLLNNNEDLYFRCFTKLNFLKSPLSPALPKNFYDYVSGYAKIDFPGSGFLIPGTDPNKIYTIGTQSYVKYAYIKVKPVGIQDDVTGIKVNPIQKAGWQFIRSYLPRIAYPGSEPATTSTNPLVNLIAMLQGIGTTMSELASSIHNSPNQRFLLGLYCAEIDCNGKSFVRLYNPHKKKLGGGHRVKQILMSDNWNSMESTESTSSYGQKYEYTATENGKEISSGVAQYEPFAGGDEISLRKPIPFEIDKQMAPNDNFFQEQPLGESFYPSPLVGYSKITITSLGSTDIAPNAAPCPNGNTVYEFYTAKDFPVHSESTGKTLIPLETNPIDGFTVAQEIVRLYGMAQGHLLELNDMHGKLKSVKAFSGTNPTAPVSEVHYYYKQSGSRLNNQVSTIDKTNVIQSQTIGQTIDLATDLRQSFTESIQVGVYYGIDISACSLGFPCFTNNPYSGHQAYGMSTACMTKIIQKYGILTKVESFDSKVKSTVENLLWDGSSGNVVLSKTTNNFEAPVYSFNYPAHWMYDGMSHEYNRHGFILKVPVGGGSIMSLSSGALPIGNVSNFLTEGDEVVFYNDAKTFYKKAWVFIDKIASTTDYYLIDEFGTRINQTNFPTINSTQNNFIKITRPVEHNLLTFSAGSVNSLVNDHNASNTLAQVISANATEYCQNWNMYDASAASPLNVNDNVGCYNTGVKNPYTSGYTGNWRLWRSLSYKTPRDYGSQEDISKDGTFTTYVPYWNKIGSDWQPLYNPNPPISFANSRWIPNYENTIYSPHGDLLETKDAIGLYHTRDYTQNHTLLKLEASNAMYKNMGYESFEDFGFVYPYLNKCGALNNDHLGFASNVGLSPTASQPYITTSQAHTGRYSIEIPPTINFNLAHFYNNTTTNTSPNPELDIPSIYNTRCAGIADLVGQNVLINKLNIDPGKYIISFWIKGPSSGANSTDFTSLFNFSITSPTLPPPTITKTNVINGWQKFDYIYNASGVTGASPLTINFSNGVTPIFMDDFRFQPFNANMVGYVYDPYQLRLWAKLDDRNFATILEYDNEGVLTRTKKETERGIYTINESRQSIIKQ